MSFEEFKKYHSANYHDGCSHFDKIVYRKSNGDDFDCGFVQDCYNHFEAGQQSKQFEIDKLRAIIVKYEAGLRKNKANKHKLLSKNIELQKRIDDALEYIAKQEWIDEYGDNQCPSYLIKKILKGETK